MPGVGQQGPPDARKERVPLDLRGATAAAEAGVAESADSPDAPALFEEAMARGGPWPEAIGKELNHHLENGTWEVIEYSDLPRGRRLHKFVWVFKMKRDGTAKGRLCVQGCTLEAGVDYDQTFSQALCHSSARALFAFAARRGCLVRSYDWVAAYLQGDFIDGEVVYCKMPPGADLDANGYYPCTEQAHCGPGKACALDAPAIYRCYDEDDIPACSPYDSYGCPADQRCVSYLDDGVIECVAAGAAGSASAPPLATAVDSAPPHATPSWCASRPNTTARIRAGPRWRPTMREPSSAGSNDPRPPSASTSASPVWTWPIFMSRTSWPRSTSCSSGPCTGFCTRSSSPRPRTSSSKNS